MSRVWLALVIVLSACAPHGPSWGPVTAFLDSAVAAGAAPGAVLGVTVAGRRFMYPAGQLGTDDPTRIEPSTVFDLASVTKVVALTTAVMLAVEDGRLDLDAPIQRYVPTFVGEGKERVTARLLLAHASGMPAWRPLFREAGSRTEAFALANETPLAAPPGTAALYSDLGLIVLTQAVEAVYHERLDSLLHRRVFEPLGMTSTGYLPPVGSPRVAPTEVDSWRGRLLRGEVHDENAARLDGISGHAGLFSSVPDLLTFAEWILDRWTDGRVDRRTQGSVQTFAHRQNLVPGATHALGWDTPSPGGSAGRLLSPGSIGHTGFTGTSLWIDPERQLAIVLLSNRVNPTRDNPRWAPVRAAIADLVMTTLLEDAR